MYGKTLLHASYVHTIWKIVSTRLSMMHVHMHHVCIMMHKFAKAVLY